MANIIWKIFFKQYSRFQYEQQATSSLTLAAAAALNWQHHYPAAIVGNATNNNNNENNQTRPPEGNETTQTLQFTNNNIGNNSAANNNNNNNSNSSRGNENCLNEVLVVNDTKIDALAMPISSTPTASVELNTTTITALTSPSTTTTTTTSSSSSTTTTTTTTTAIRTTATAQTTSALVINTNDLIMDTKNQNEAMSGRAGNVSAPIACEEEVETYTNQHQNQNQYQNENKCCPPKEVECIGNTVQRSKSRVRAYLKKCKQRLTGHQQQQQQQQQAQQHQEPEQHATVECTTTRKPINNSHNNDNDIVEHHHKATVNDLPCSGNTLAKPFIVAKLTSVNEEDIVVDADKNVVVAVAHAVPIPMHDNDDDNNTAPTTTTAKPAPPQLEQQQQQQHEEENVLPPQNQCVQIAPTIAAATATTTSAQPTIIALKEQQLAHAIVMESGIGTLMDKHIAHIFPNYAASTRATLLRQARDVLVCNYHGCLQSFEREFLCKFAEIATILKAKHAIGESLIWREGWPLATPTGELILHLGDLDESLLRPADIYLSVNKADQSADTQPALYAIWRTTTNTNAIIQKHCVDIDDPKASYLSILALEMLSDELPQLLQNLIVGVERTIERVSLNDLQMPIAAAFGSDQMQQNDHKMNKTNTNNKNNNNNGFGTLLRSNQTTITTTTTTATTKITNSPKCALKRSELITKNKTFNQRYMLRRSTNRQDSINSNSSGNSTSSSASASSGTGNGNGNGNGSSNASISVGSTTSDELNAHINNHNNLNNIEDHAKRPHGNNSPSTSPALPLFCLGNSFPHIDSDEENADDKRNSMECDAVSTEIIPPSSITEIPEKLLATGIYLPGTRDKNGHPIITIEADAVVEAGLNCYEIATVLLYYTTIPEGNLNVLVNGKSMQRPSLAIQAVNSPTTATTAVADTKTTAENVEPAQQQQQQQQTFTILIALEKTQHLCVIDLICQSLKLLKQHVAYCEILVVCLDASVLQFCKNTTPATATTATTTATITPLWKADDLHQQQQQQQCHLVKFISVDEVTTSVAPSQVPHAKLQGMHHHDARKWREFFALLEPFQRQCASAGERLVVAMNDIRAADQQGLPTRRQLYAQHRALSRALMDSELHNLRKRGMAMLACLQELAKGINGNNTDSSSSSSSSTSTTTNNNNNIINNQPNNQHNQSNCHNKLLLKTATAATTKATATALNYNNANQQLSSNYSFSSNYQSNNNHHHFNTKTHKSHQLSYNSSIKSANDAVTSPAVLNNNNNNNSSSSNTNENSNSSNNNNNNNNNHNDNIDVAIKLNKVTLLFNEVDRAAKRLEQLTEQRREYLRELTRQRALEDEIYEVTSWISSDGNETLQRFAKLQLDSVNELKEHEQEFEKYYFISMKHLAKGRDLYDAAANMNVLRESSLNLKAALDCFTDKLEHTRERIEGATRLHHLMNQHTNDMELQQEMQRLAENIGLKELLEKYYQQQRQEQTKQQQLEQQQQKQQLTQYQSQLQQQPQSQQVREQIVRIKPNTLNLNSNHNTTITTITTTTTTTKPYGNMFTSTPTTLTTTKTNRSSYRSSSGNGSFDGPTCHCWRESRSFEDMDELLDTTEEDEDGEEEQSKIADSGLGGCERCENNPKLTRICSCQSLNEAENMCDKRHTCDEFDDDCFQRPSKRYLDIHSPMEANTHLQCHASNLNLPKMEELSCLDPKIQKTLLLIMREMIGTERDYVRSLYYVIENYIDELLRDDIPQPLRGQRNVIFGNIEKIFEFHNANFLSELERYEHNPLKVGAAFLQMESKFYLYALYNKNKPKSDTLMSEYGTAFFKPKQFELNDKMDLASYLLKPVQRMGKYALLLQQLVKACSTVKGSALQEIAVDVEELQRAEEMVKFQLRHGNDLLAMDSLRDCDVNVKEQGRLLRQNEFLVSQGRGGKKTLRQVFLFEELVLFSKARRFPDHKNLDIYIYKNSIKTSDIGLTAHVGDSPTKFEIWFRKRKPDDTWTLQCMSEDIKNAWTEEVSKLLWKQAKRNREIRLAEMSSMGIGSKPCLDIRPSNNQINDRSITITQLGKAPKLRHSFVGLHAEPNKSLRRPNSLISESSISSGTSSSSMSTGSSAGVPPNERHGGSINRNHNNNNSNSSNNSNNSNSNSNSNNNNNSQCHVLELINETQTLTLSSGNSNNGNSDTNTLSSNASSGVSGGNLRNHKRSTTLVSQLSMESGIISDVSITPDRELPDNIKSWSTATTPTGAANIFTTTTTNTAGVIMRRHKNVKNEQQKQLTNELTAAKEMLTNTTTTTTEPAAAAATAAPSPTLTVNITNECKQEQATHY